MTAFNWVSYLNKMTETKVLLNRTFDKVQGKIYTEIDCKKCQVKEKFSLSAIKIEVDLFKRLNQK